MEIEQLQDSLEVGNRLRELREFHGLSQNKFAKRIKMAQSTVALFEAGKRFLKPLYVRIISDEFGCDESWIRYGVGVMVPKKKNLTIDEYAEKYNLTPVEKDIVLNFMELNERTKQEALESFVNTIAETRKSYENHWQSALETTIKLKTKLSETV